MLTRDNIYLCVSPLTYVHIGVDWHCHWQKQLKNVFSFVLALFLIDLGGKSSSGAATYAFVLDSILDWKFLSRCSIRSEFVTERWSAFESTRKDCATSELNAVTWNDFPVEIEKR